MTLTMIPGLYLMEQDPMSSRSQLMWWIPSQWTWNCGGEAGLCLCKWTLLVKLSLGTPCLQPKGLETSSL